MRIFIPTWTSRTCRKAGTRLTVFSLKNLSAWMGPTKCSTQTTTSRIQAELTAYALRLCFTTLGTMIVNLKFTTILCSSFAPLKNIAQWTRPTMSWVRWTTRKILATFLPSYQNPRKNQWCHQAMWCKRASTTVFGSWRTNAVIPKISWRKQSPYPRSKQRASAKSEVPKFT